MRTTSGRSFDAKVDGLAAVARAADELEVVRRPDELLEPVAHDGVVVGDEDADHRSGSLSVTRVPAPGVESMSRLPPRSAAWSTSSASPRCPSERRSSSTARSKPRPSSATTSTTSEPFAWTSMLHVSAPACSTTLRSASCAVRKTRRSVVVARPDAVGDVDVDRDPACDGLRCEVVQRRLEAGVAQVRRIDLDEQRAQLAHRLSRRVRAGAQRACDLARRCVVDLLRSDGQRIRRAGEILHDAVVEVGCDDAPLHVRRVERAQEQRLALRVRAAETSCERERDRQLQQPEHEQRDEERGQEREPDLATARRDVAEPEVRLEQERPTARRVHRHVHLEQLAARPLVPVLRRREVADAGLDAVASQRRHLVVAERIARADETGLVRVRDTPVRRPELDAHDGAAQHALTHEPVERGDLHAVAADDAVVEVRLDDAPSEHLRQAARVAHGLAFTGAAEHDRRRERDDEHRREARECELHEEPPARRRSVAGKRH